MHALQNVIPSTYSEGILYIVHQKAPFFGGGTSFLVTQIGLEITKQPRLTLKIPERLGISQNVLEPPRTSQNISPQLPKSWNGSSI